MQPRLRCLFGRLPQADAMLQHRFGIGQATCKQPQDQAKLVAQVAWDRRSNHNGGTAS